ncbi:unnamed protein product [Meloidogyne enterolobii]
MAIKFLLNSNAKNCFLANLPQVLLLILQKSRQVSLYSHHHLLPLLVLLLFHHTNQNLLIHYI